MIVIIGILAAIIIPVAGMARKSAAQAKCITNLRSLGTAFALYANDNKNRIPDFTGTPSFYDNIRKLVPLLNPYIVGNDATRYRWGNTNPNPIELWKCPRDNISLTRGFAAPYHGSSYDFQFQYRGQQITDPMLSGTPAWEGALNPVPLSQAPLMWDQEPSNHDLRRNYLFVDGHVKLMPADYRQPYAFR
ncbi:hypothetical protein OPIT5_06565 [Opitutaceae bacterium TAV5]|nr:hypothetical protein OPIT5_06565 [Opitutaceae bacterium TAV5]